MFRRASWTTYMARHGFRVLAHEPAGIFYTGHMILGAHLSIRARQRLAWILGSSCHLFEVR